MNEITDIAECVDEEREITCYGVVCPHGSTCSRGMCILSDCSLLLCGPDAMCSVNNMAIAECVIPVCHASKPNRSVNEADWCCFNRGLQCSESKEDACKTTAPSDMLKWSFSKKQYCCKHQGVCIPEEGADQILVTGTKCALGAAWRCYLLLAVGCLIDMFFMAAGCTAALAVVRSWYKRFSQFTASPHPAVASAEECL